MGGNKQRRSSGESDHMADGAWAMAAGLIAVSAGTAMSAMLVWIGWLVLPPYLPLSVLAVSSLALLYIGFFASLFAGGEIMDAVALSRPPKLARIGAVIATGFVELVAAGSAAAALVAAPGTPAEVKSRSARRTTNGTNRVCDGPRYVASGGAAAAGD